MTGRSPQVQPAQARTFGLDHRRHAESEVALGTGDVGRVHCHGIGALRRAFAALCRGRIPSAFQFNSDLRRRPDPLRGRLWARARPRAARLPNGIRHEPRRAAIDGLHCRRHDRRRTHCIPVVQRHDPAHAVGLAIPHHRASCAEPLSRVFIDTAARELSPQAPPLEDKDYQYLEALNVRMRGDLSRSSADPKDFHPTADQIHRLARRTTPGADRGHRPERHGPGDRLVRDAAILSESYAIRELNEDLLPR